MLPKVELRPTVVILRTYTEEAIQVAGEVLVDVQYGQQEAKQLPLIVVGLGISWLQYLQLLKTVTQPLNSVLDNAPINCMPHYPPYDKGWELSGDFRGN